MQSEDGLLLQDHTVHAPAGLTGFLSPRPGRVIIRLQPRQEQPWHT